MSELIHKEIAELQIMYCLQEKRHEHLSQDKLTMPCGQSVILGEPFLKCCICGNTRPYKRVPLTPE